MGIEAHVREMPKASVVSNYDLGLLVAATQGELLYSKWKCISSNEFEQGRLAYFMGSSCRA